MKVFILFKVKDMSKRKKDFIIDNIYLTEEAAYRREVKLHYPVYSSRMRRILSFLWSRPIRSDNQSVWETKTQQTYYISKSIRGNFDDMYFKQVTPNHG